MGSETSNSTDTSEPSCRIVVVSPSSGEDCLTELRFLPRSARIVAIGNSLDELLKEGYNFMDADVLLNLRGSAASIGPIIREMPNITWIHSVTAGVDHIMCPEICDNDKLLLTNAKGIFSSGLAEYVMGAISYFSKDFPRLIRQRQSKNWEKFCVDEIRGKTMGIVGYGDIGIACAKLANAYGMRVVGLRRNPELSSEDKLIDKMYGTDELHELLQISDYVVVAVALTEETKGMLGAEQFAHSKKGQILINVARGPVIVEDDLVEALTNGNIAGAALDVFCEEPLPKTSKFWDLENVLLSPHNADQTVDFRHKSVQFFCENCARYIADLPLRNIISARNGY